MTTLRLNGLIQVDRAALLRYLAALFACYGLFLAIAAPAALLAWVIPAMPLGMALENPAGTLWRGEAGAVTFRTADSAGQVRGVKWDFQWRHLLRGELAVKLELAGSAGSATLARGFRGLRVREADFVLPVSVLTEAFPQLAPWQPGGEVQLKTAGFSTAGGADSEAAVFWRNASLNLTEVSPLGEYRLSLRGTADSGKTLHRLETLSGALKLEGSGEWSPDGLTFNGVAQASPQRQAELQPLLRLLGKDRGDGVHAVNLQLK